MTNVRRWGPGLLLVSPSILLILVFVFGLIGWNVKVSLSDWRTSVPSSHWAGLKAYRDLGFPFKPVNADPAWCCGPYTNLRHIVVFTVAFILGTLLIGLTLAFLLEKGVRGEGFFRSVYLFPMAVSFIAAGVVWRWLMNPAPGDRATGLNVVFDKLGVGFLGNQWYLGQNWGMAAMAMPAIWQLSGYVMALFLSGFRGIPAELREAALVDGASTFQLYRRVIFPQLTPTALSAMIILGHMSMKMFDLIMSVSGAQSITEVPAVYVWQTLLTSDYAKAAAISIVLLLLVAVVIVPYLIYNNRVERSQ